MTTIAKNRTRLIAQLKTDLTRCRVYTLGNQFLGADVDPAHAWAALACNSRAKLTSAAAKGTYTVHVHSNCWYELSAPDPAVRAEG